MKPQIPGYTIGRRLGQGAFGKVYQGIEAATGRYVAIKVMMTQLPSHLRMLVREVHNLHRQLHNEHVVDFVDCDLDAPLPYLVMEYCDAGTLDEWAEESGAGWRDVAAALLHSAEGLHAIHQAGGFHRDIKPQNLLLTHEDDGTLRVKLGDFGLARIPASEGSALTQSPWGSPAYMAPEVLAAFKGEQEQVYTASADIYSLGITGIELLTGQRNRSKLSKAHPEPLRQTLLLMTSPNRNQRPSASEVSERLQELLQADAEQPAPKPKSGNGLWPWLVGGVALGGVALLGAAIAAAIDDD